MPHKTYGVALIGCGAMGAAHLDEIYCMEHVNVVAVCDTDEERAREFAHRYGAQRIETDYRALMDNPLVDIVIIATYPGSHLEILSACLAAGKHVICEKPLAATLEDGEKMVRLIRENPQCKVLVGYILRHNQTYRHVAEMIQNDAIGHPIVMRMTQNHHTMDWPKYKNLILNTSPIIDCGVHYYDVMRWFTGAEITAIRGIGQKTEPDLPDGTYNYGMTIAELSDGSIGYYEAGWSNSMSSSNTKEFIGPKGRISVTYQMWRQQNQEEGDLIEYYRYPEGTYETINSLCSRKPTGDQLNALIDMIENNAPANPSIEDVWKSFTIAFRADSDIRSRIKQQNSQS